MYIFILTALLIYSAKHIEFTGKNVIKIVKYFKCTHLLNACYRKKKKKKLLAIFVSKSKYLNCFDT